MRRRAGIAAHQPDAGAGENLTPTQPQLQELPSVADLADRLLPAVVEITIEAGNGASTDARTPPDAARRRAGPAFAR